MPMVKNTHKITERPEIQINDELKEQFGQVPLFPEKIEKATRIMMLVREKQRAKK